MAMNNSIDEISRQSCVFAFSKHAQHLSTGNFLGAKALMRQPHCVLFLRAEFLLWFEVSILKFHSRKWYQNWNERNPSARIIWFIVFNYYRKLHIACTPQLVNECIISAASCRSHACLKLIINIQVCIDGNSIESQITASLCWYLCSVIWWL